MSGAATEIMDRVRSEPPAAPSGRLRAGRPSAGLGIAVSGLSHDIDGQPVLRDITLDLTERRVALIGLNGSGKTTFARCLNGLIRPDEGVVRVDGLDTRTAPQDVRRKVGFVFQNPDHQIVFPTVGEDIGFGLRNRKRPAAEVRAAVDRILDRFGLLGLRDRPVHGLSGGEKRLVTLLSVLVMEPSYLVLDEPTTFLDLRYKRILRGLVRDLPQTVIMITHDLDEIVGFDRAILFENGRVALDGAPSEVVPRYVEAHS